MAHTAPFSALAKRCGQLHQAMAEARWAVCEAKPPAGDLHLVDRLADVLVELMDQVKRCERISQSVSHLSADAAGNLRRVQSLTDATGSRMYVELLSYEVGREIVGARRHGELWRGWAKEARQALARCRAPLDDVRRAILACWKWLMRSPAVGLVVQTTNVGQVVQRTRSSPLSERRDAKSVRRNRGLGPRPPV